MVTESKIELTDRLRRQGLWDEASLNKDTVKSRLRSEGKSRKEAGELAWAETQKRYPAKDPPEVRDFYTALADGAYELTTPRGDAAERSAFTRVWFALRILEAISRYQTMPSEQRHLARHKIRQTLDGDPPHGGLVALTMALVERGDFRTTAERILRNQLTFMPDDDCDRRCIEGMLGQLDSDRELFPTGKPPRGDGIDKVVPATEAATDQDLTGAGAREGSTA